MVSLPQDIWLYVAQFMFETDLYEMIGVNRALFHLGMDARYRSISFEDFDDTTLNQLRRLKDPAIAPRVRYLSVNPFHEEAGFDEEGDEIASDAMYEGIVQVMTETVSFFHNVIHFSLEWSFESPAEDILRPFLAMAWKTFEFGLHKIVLKVDLGNYPVLFSDAGPLPALEELELDLTDRSLECLPEDIHAVLVTDIAPFINKVAPTLRSLSLLSFSEYMEDDPSFEAFDYSLLFNAVGDIPNLETLVVGMEFDLCGLQDSRGLTRILRNHIATLRHVKWTTSDWYQNCPTKNSFNTWMEENRSDGSILSDLLTLEILIPSNSLGFNLQVEYIMRSADTLTSLALSGSFLSFDQVKTVLSLFAHRRERRFEALVLHIVLLSPKLVAMMAEMIPRLHKLTLRTRSVATVLQEWKDPEEGVEELTNVGLPDEMGNSDVRNWQLFEIDIATLGHSDSDMDLKLMRLFHECISFMHCDEY